MVKFQYKPAPNEFAILNRFRIVSRIMGKDIALLDVVDNYLVVNDD